MNPKRPTIRHSPHSQSACQIHPNFYSGAKTLRGYFEEVFSNPHSTDSRRFCWDPWSVEGQYRLLRTPAQSFFPKTMFSGFLDYLLRWGRENLGCQMISHPWLSAYTDRCYQGLHSDVPHGPFSFVYSLTNWNARSFSGGETLIAQPTLLRYFSEMQKGASHEEKDLLRSVPARFNQLTVFDPRYPHGVRMVQGVESILDSRLVIHGWFTDPRPMLEGALSFKQILRPMDSFASNVMSRITSSKNVSGLLSLRLHIHESGVPASVDVLSSNLLHSTGSKFPKKALEEILGESQVSFPKARSKTRLTLPLLFQG